MMAEAFQPELIPYGRAGLSSSGRTGEPVRLGSRKDVAFFEIGCKSVLNRCDTERMPDIWTINPYRGCEFGCGYCYARYTHEYLGFEKGEGFERTIFVKASARQVLEATLKPEELLKRPIALGTATDPYQPAERRFRITRGILQVLARYRGIALSLVTKSPLILRDLELLGKIDSHASLTVLISLSSLNRRVLEVFDPRAPSASMRLKTLEALARAGLYVGLHCAPILPGITDGRADLERLCRAARDHGARFLGAEVLFLTSTIRARFWPLLKAHFPKQVRLYRLLYGRGMDAPEAYRRRVLGMVQELRARYGLEGRRPRLTGLYRPEPGQEAHSGQLELAFQP